MDTFSVFMPIMKLDQDKRTVTGYASTPAEDSDGEIVTIDAIKGALPGYMKFANIREMHQLKAIGKAAEANVDKTGLFLTAKIVDDAAWQKCLEGVYTGFSIGGRKLAKEGKKITKLAMNEISVVDRPANPECTFAIAKRKKDFKEPNIGYLLPSSLSAEQKALVKMAKTVKELAKAGPPAAHDGFSLPAKVIPNKEPDAVLSVNDSRPNENVTRKAGDETTPCAAHGKVGCKECLDKADADAKAKKPYGDVDYADEGLQGDGKHRYPIDTEEHVRAAWNYINKPKNAGKYSPENASKVKAKIVAAWKKHVHKDGPPAAQKKKEVAKAAEADLMKALGVGDFAFLTLGQPEGVPKLKKNKKIQKAVGPELGSELAEDFLSLPKRDKALAKSMSSVGSLAYVFDSIRSAQRSLLMEGKREGGDKKDHQLANTLGMVAKQLAGVIGQKAEHEGQEATTLTDADDQWVNLALGEKDMTEKVVGGFGDENTDPLTKAILATLHKAAQPTRAMRCAKAREDIGKARKSMKMARKEIEEVHKMMKASYMSKAAKKAKKPDDDDGDDFDHAEVMGKLNKAFGHLNQARDMGKAADGEIEKAMGRSGQRGQEAGDAEAGFYEVPPGVKDLTPAAMAGASPGGRQQGSQPPQYPLDGGVFPGKAAGMGDLMKFAKNGQVPVELVNMLAKAQANEQQLELMKGFLANNGRQRPYMNLPGRVFDGMTGVADPQKQDLNKALFNGVDVSKIDPEGRLDEGQHQTEVAKAIGNFLTSGAFSRNIMDPSFKGTVGG